MGTSLTGFTGAQASVDRTFWGSPEIHRLGFGGRPVVGALATGCADLILPSGSGRTDTGRSG